MVWIILNVVVCAVGAAIAVAGRQAITSSINAYKEISTKNKYIKINAINFATPGLILIAIGAVVVISPLMLQVMANKKESAVFTIAVNKIQETCPEKTTCKNFNDVAINLPVDHDKCLTPEAIATLYSFAERQPRNATSKICVITYGFKENAATSKVVEITQNILVAKGIDGKRLDTTCADLAKQACPQYGAGVSVIVTGEKK